MISAIDLKFVRTCPKTYCTHPAHSKILQIVDDLTKVQRAPVFPFAQTPGHGPPAGAGMQAIVAFSTCCYWFRAFPYTFKFCNRNHIRTQRSRLDTITPTYDY